jgi:hypothetical protein
MMRCAIHFFAVLGAVVALPFLLIAYLLDDFLRHRKISRWNGGAR